MTFFRTGRAFLIGACLLAACTPFPPRGQAPSQPAPGQGPAPSPGSGQGQGQAGPEQGQGNGEPAAPPRRHYAVNDPSGYPKSAEAVSGAAVMDLLKQSRVEASSGRPEQALATLEMALNIEPRNPFVWEEMATVHLARNLPEEAEHVAVRSNSFARGNPWVEVVNWRTIMQARLARGDTTGAQEASDHYQAIAARLAE